MGLTGSVGAVPASRERTPGPLLARFHDAHDADRTRAGIQLLCFPYAGGGTHVFRSWSRRLPARISVTAVRLPGREQRFREPEYDSWPQALQELAEALGPETERGPCVFFGHSLGARLAYELVHRLVAEGCRPPQLLIVSACRGPGVPARWPPMHAMDRVALTARLRKMEGVPEEVLSDPRLMAFFEPTLRADLRLAETWQASPGRIPAPILALCGERDIVDPHQDMLAWRHHTTEGFAIRSFPGGHFFLHELEEAVVAEVLAQLPEGGAR